MQKLVRVYRMSPKLFSKIYSYLIWLPVRVAISYYINNV